MISLITIPSHAIAKSKQNCILSKYEFKTDLKVPKLGVMLVGWGGNNGSTVTAGILANKHNITWETKYGKKTPNFFGSIT